jgi:uncharacterized lipoprotein YbaY
MFELQSHTFVVARIALPWQLMVAMTSISTNDEPSTPLRSWSTITSKTPPFQTFFAMAQCFDCNLV